MRKLIFEPGARRALSGMVVLAVSFSLPINSVSAQTTTPEVANFLSVNVQGVSSSEEPGQQLVRLDLRVHNAGSDTLYGANLFADFADRLGAAFVGTPEQSLIVSSDGVAPQVRRRLNEATSSSLLRRPVTLAPDASFRMRLPILVQPELATDPESLSVQIELKGKLSDGTEVTDLSDNGTEATGPNNLFAGREDYYDDPTPLYGEFPMLTAGANSVDFSADEVRFDAWLADQAGFRVSVPEGCGPAVYERSLTTTENGVEVSFEYLDQCGHRLTQQATYTGSKILRQLLDGTPTLTPMAMYCFRGTSPGALAALPFSEIGFGVASLAVAPLEPLFVPLVDRFPEPVVSGLPFQKEVVR